MSKDQTRRNFVGAAGIAASTVATTASLRPASAQTATAVPKMEYAIKKLPFDPAKIKGIPRSCSSAITRTNTAARSSG